MRGVCDERLVGYETNGSLDRLGRFDLPFGILADVFGILWAYAPLKACLGSRAV